MHMASTPNKKKATSVGKSAKGSSKRSPKPQPKNPQRQSKSKGSLGLGLLLIAIGTSLVGLGGLGYFLYQEFLGSSKREIDRSAEVQTQQFESKLSVVQQNVDGIASAAKVLAQQPSKPKGVEPYQKLLVDGLQKPDPIIGIGIAQNENLLFVTAKPISPYVWKEQSGLKIEAPETKIAGANANDKFLAGNRPDIQTTSSYKAAIAKGKAAWSEPYSALGKTIITYSSPISDGQKTLGVVSADVLPSNILSLIDTATYPNPSNESKIGFVVISSSGKVITASSLFQTSQAQDPASAQALTDLAQQSKTQPSGIAQSGGNLWAYRKINGSDFLVVSYLPESEITNKLLVLVGGTAIGISAILAIAVLAFVNSLKNRLKPLTEECDRFLTQQGNSKVDLAGKDEIDRLSLSLKSTLQRANSNELRLRSELRQTASSDDISAAQIQQGFADTELMEAEVGDLLDVVSSMEEGDLTIEAQVNDRATGLVADTLNRLREKLVEIISSVLGTAQQVAQGASDLEELARTVVLNTAEQAQSVTQGQALTEQVAKIASRSSAQVNTANQSLQEVRDTVSSGQTAINTLTESISVLQTGSAQIVQRMKTLGEFVGLAEQFVQDQGQIASLTQVLALNATLVAARAAEQKDPKQFAGVAREFESIAGQVNDLATQTNDGLTVLQQRTSQIQTVVTAIDVEVQNLSGLVAGFTAGVESSQSAFNSIQMATEEVVQIGQTITESSTEIAYAAGSTASYISEIAQLADRTADLTRSARQQAEEMGNQAQQLLQGIQFFRLPEATASFNTATNIATPVVADASNTSVNGLLDNSTESANADANNGDFGIVLPAIGVAGAAIAISQLGQEEFATEYIPTAINELDDNAELIAEEPLISNSDSLFALDLESAQDRNFEPSSGTMITDEQSVDPLVENDYSESQSSEASYSEITDISAIEASLLADLRQEIYDESSLIDIEDDLSVEATTMKNPMEGVDEYAIVEASGDPLIASATSSFLEDTAFGTPAPLSEEALANLPTSVDFSIPDLDYDDDFTIPNMTIESTLDNSNAFFEVDSTQQLETNNAEADFDAFYAVQAVTDSNDNVSDDISELNSFDEDSSVSIAENVSEAFISNGAEDYSDYVSHEAHNLLLNDSLELSPNEAFSDTFDASFDESPFDVAFDEAIHHSLDDLSDGSLLVDETPHYDLPVQQVSDELDLSQSSDMPSDGFATQEYLAGLPTQIPDVYFANSPELEEEEEFSFEFEESLLTSGDLVGSDNILDDSSFIQNSEEIFDAIDTFDISEPIQEVEEDPFTSGFAIAAEPEIQNIQISEPEEEEFSFEFEESLLTSDDLVESDNILDDSSFIQNSEGIFDAMDTFDISEPIQEVEEDPFTSGFAIAAEPEIQNIQISEPEEENLETNFPSLLDRITDDEVADSIWEPEAVIYNMPEEQEDISEGEISDTSDLTEDLDLPTYSSETLQADDTLLDEIFDVVITDELDGESNAFGAEELSVATMDDSWGDLGLLDVPSREFVVDASEDISAQLLTTVPPDNIFDTSKEFTEPDIELSEFSETIVPEISTSPNILDFEESSIFDSQSNDLNSEFSEDSLDIMPSEINDIRLASELTESIPDLSLDFSDDWLQEINNDEDGLSSETSSESSYRFADNLLDSLMEESDEEIPDLSMDLSGLSLDDDDLSLSGEASVDLKTEANNSLESSSEDSHARDSESQFDFDFSVFNEIEDLGSIKDTEDSIVTARAEIDDFLSGALGIEEFGDESPQSKVEEINALKTNTNQPKQDKPVINEA